MRKLIVFGALLAFTAVGSEKPHEKMDQVFCAASKALSVSNDPEDLSGAVAEFGSSKVGVGLKLRLAKSHFDNDKFQEALEVYEAIAKDVDKDSPFFDIAILGRAYSLEGLKKYLEAQEVFSAYASDEAKTHDGYRLTAQFGVARCMAQHQKSAAEAVAYLKGLKDATLDEAKKRQFDAIIFLLKHYDFNREDATLLDQFPPLDLTLEPEQNSATPR